MYTFELQIHDASGRDTTELLVIDRNIELYGLGLDFQGRYQSLFAKGCGVSILNFWEQVNGRFRFSFQVHGPVRLRVPGVGLGFRVPKSSRDVWMCSKVRLRLSGKFKRSDGNNA